MKHLLANRLNGKYFVAPDGCWLWLGSLNNKGYASTSIDGILKMAHRWSYEIYIDEIPPNMQIDHLCRTRSCINPYHLRIVTNAENNMAKPGVRVCEHNRGYSKCHICKSKYAKEKYSQITEKQLRHKREYNKEYMRKKRANLEASNCI